ncbi:MAG: PHA/PHB synthase family protein [Vulcanimicrobiaceae bacterium]
MSASMAPEELSYGLEITGLDPASLVDALRAVINDAMADPLRLTTWMTSLAIAEQTVGFNMLRRLAGEDAEPASPISGDRRFADPGWKHNPFLAGMVEDYLVRTRAALSLIESSRVPESTRRKAAFAMTLFNDAVAPSNLPWINPAVLKEAMDTGGQSLLRGLKAFMEDVQHNGGVPRQVDASSFTLGVSLAATPGRIVYRNELMELIAYEPQSAHVHEIPLLCCPPWINKYYIMDLAPGRSFVEWAVHHGHQTFMISYRNPDAAMAHLKMDDYLHLGPLAALSAVERITGTKQTNIAALCLGGTLALILLAYLASTAQAERIASATLTNTLVDFAEPGDLAVFTDESTIERLEKRMNERGYLKSEEMAGTFHWMRANDLIWSYVINNWFMGRKAPAFDILAWNNDGTHLPAAMHSQYLRACYLNNAIVKPNSFVVGETPIDLRMIRTPLYVLAAEGDHIAPWRSNYMTVSHVGAEDVKFTLTNSGHIAGIVNPPGSAKSAYWTKKRALPSESANEWRESAHHHEGSWWGDWAAWIEQHSGHLVPSYGLPPGEPAPGPYVRNEFASPFESSEARVTKRAPSNKGAAKKNNRKKPG